MSSDNLLSLPDKNSFVKVDWENIGVKKCNTCIVCECSSIAKIPLFVDTIKEPYVLDISKSKWVTVRDKDKPVSIVTKKKDLLERVKNIMSRKIKIINIKIED